MGVNFSGTFERMLESGSLKNGAQLARMLGITSQAVTNYRKKGALPEAVVFKFAESYRVSLDWLVTGEGEKFRSATRVESTKKTRMIAMVEMADLSGGAKECVSRDFSLSVLSPDEVLYVGKLLEILRARGGYANLAVKAMIDFLLKHVSPESSSKK